ncbi:MAG TPA: AAA family ATPase [Candidatus Kapabacteria bacterium]|nr:AAA family ATPase [Candidatus Kapabacteria bacterium]
MSPRIRDFINRGIMPLVGRERELGLVLEAFAGLLEGEPRAIWMHGPAGVGKSRLLDELKSRAREGTSRSLVVHAKWYEGEGIELGPLSNALEVLRPALAAPLAARIYRDGAVATVDAAVEAVQIASRRYPVVLILDDLHYLSSSSELSRFVTAIEEIPLLLVATTRPVENAALRSFRSALAGSIPPQELEIGPLDGAGLAEAVTSLFGVQPPEEMLGQIAALSGGLPLALREVFRELLATEHLIAAPDGTWEWRSASLPDDDLRAIGDRVHGFSGRLASLPDTEQHILALAAYLGEQFNRDLLRALAERTGCWDDHAFERLILGGFVSVSTPSVRLGARETEGRVCFAFTHTLLWKAATALEPHGATRAELAGITLDILTRGTGELYTVAPLEALDAMAIPAGDRPRLFAWLVTVGRRLSPIYAEAFVALCHATLEPFRSGGPAAAEEGALPGGYLDALAVYGDRLYITGAREALRDIANEIASVLDRIGNVPPAGTEDRMTRLDAAVVVWKDALTQGNPERAKGFLDELLKVLPPPAEQSDRELRGAAEAIRLVASYSFSRGDFAEGLDLAAPYIGEMDRMRPETLNALFKVLLPAMMQAGRVAEAGEMVETGLRLRREADLFTEYELLLHAANYAQGICDWASVRRYATDARQLIDRYPAYRNLSTNYFHLPLVAAGEGHRDELAQLETDFRAVPPPARSSRMQWTIAQHRFQLAWNLLGESQRSLRFAHEMDPDERRKSPHLSLQVAREELRACIDLGDLDGTVTAETRINTICEGLGEAFSDPGTAQGRRTQILRLLSQSLSESEFAALAEHCHTMPVEEIEGADGFRVARILLRGAELSDGKKRDLNDAAYAIIDMSIAKSLQDSVTGMAYRQLDLLSALLPKTRLARFKQSLGKPPYTADEESGEAASPVTETQPQRQILRAFGALRIEGTEDVGAKLESKTRTLVAALVVARLGDTRSLGELTRDRLADLLWPDMPTDKAVNNLHATLSYARRFLGGSTTVQQRDGVYTLGDDVAIDAVEFRENVKKGNRLHGEGVYFGAAVAYRAALDLATGDFLEGMYAEWVDTVRESLRGELATALERLIALEIDRDGFAAVPPLAERLLALDDLHDGAYEALIRSAAARGARREAFSYFNRYEAALDAYGAGPARRISELMTRVRAGEM